MKLLLYCTKSKPYLYKDRGIEYALSDKKLVDSAFTRFNPVNGKIVAECDYEVEEISTFYADYYHEELAYETNTLTYDELLEKSCLNNQQLDNYLYGDNGYAIHIKNLHIYNEPRELNEYKKHNPEKDSMWGWLSKAPQNMMYCFDVFQNHYVLISIHPEWLCKILNGEKTVEVRKKVLKRMLENER